MNDSPLNFIMERATEFELVILGLGRAGDERRKTDEWKNPKEVHRMLLSQRSCVAPIIAIAKIGAHLSGGSSDDNLGIHKIRRVRWTQAANSSGRRSGVFGGEVWPSKTRWMYGLMRRAGD